MTNQSASAAASSCLRVCDERLSDSASTGPGIALWDASGVRRGALRRRDRPVQSARADREDRDFERFQDGPEQLGIQLASGEGPRDGGDPDEIALGRRALQDPRIRQPDEQATGPARRANRSSASTLPVKSSP